MFRALPCPSSGARKTAVAAPGFRMTVEVEVFSVVVGLLVIHAERQQIGIDLQTSSYLALPSRYG